MPHSGSTTAPSTSAAELQRLLARALETAGELLAREGTPAEPASRDPERLRRALDLALGADGLEADRVLARLHAILAATPSSSSWRFVNQLFGGREPIATAAEMLAVLPNISMYTFKAGGAQILVEQELIRHMAAKLGLPEAAEGTFAPGGSIANLIAMLLARNAAVPESRDRGIEPGQLTVYTSVEAHYSIPKNAGILGIGRDVVRRIPVDGAGRMRVDLLGERIAADRDQGRRPMLVNATAGTTVRGAFDRLRPIAEIAHAAGAWFHVDGALGATMALCPSRRELVDGIELADSVSWNPHKMMGVPLQCSLLLVARPGALAASLDETADYLFQVHGDELNPGHRSIQCGRRNDALKLWAAWRLLGDQGWDARIRRQLELARLAAERIAADSDLELVEPPPSINVCFEVRGVDSARLCDELDRTGRLEIGWGKVGESRALRLVCVNPALDEHALDQIFAEIKSAARTLRAPAR